VLREDRCASFGAGDRRRFERGGIRSGLDPDLAAAQKSRSLAL